MSAFTKASFSCKIDSRGRVTLPSRIRNQLGLEKGDRLSLTVESSRILRKEFDRSEEALKYVSGLEDVESFSFDGSLLEVIFSE